VGNHNGDKLNQRQESWDDTMDRAKDECNFTDRLYDILLAHQRGQPLGGRPPGTPPGNVGELNPAMSRIYNLIWSAAIDLNGKGKIWKKNKQQEAKAA
jgi:hypothetical protein